MNHRNNRDRKLLVYLHANLVERWNLLSKPEKRYASELVKKFGWSTSMAVQHAFFFPYDPWIIDCRSNKPFGCYEVDCNTGIIKKER